MKKLTKVLALTLGSLMLFTSIGCGGGGTPDVYVEADPSKPAQIRFAVFDQAELYQQMANDFHDMYPNWTVRVEEVNDKFYEDLQIQYSGGKEPDMFVMELGQISQFVRDDLLLNLSLYLDKSEDLSVSDLWDANDGYKYDKETKTLGEGSYYAFIKDISAEFIMFYNKDHIDEYDRTHQTSLAQKIGYPVEGSTGYPSRTIPMSWQQNLEMCRELTVLNGQGDFVRRGTFFDYIPYRHIMQWAGMGGSSIFSTDGKTFNANDQAVKAAFKHMTDYQSGQYKSTSPFDTTQGIESMRGFKNGTISVVWNGLWSWDAYDLYNCSFVDIAPAPTPNGGANSVYNATNCNGISISKNSANPAVAYKFLEYVMTVGTAQAVMEGKTFNVPGNKTIASSDAFLNPSNPRKAEINTYFYNMTLNAKPFIFSPYIDTAKLEELLGMKYGETWTANPTSIDTALANCKTEIEKVIENNIKRG